MPPQPSSRRPLGAKQFDILFMLYRFRFATSNLLTYVLGAKSLSVTNIRLGLLMKQGYIGRNYDSSYRLCGKPASYYLVTKGIQALRRQPVDGQTEATLHNRHKDRTASQGFVNHALAVFALHNKLLTDFGDSLLFFSSSDTALFKYFPRPIPDSFIRLQTGESERCYFLEILDTTKPFFAHIKHLKLYRNYREEGTWGNATGLPMPMIIFLCETKKLLGQVQRYIDRDIVGLFEDEYIIAILSSDITSKLSQS